MSLLNEMELSDSERGGHNVHAPASRAFSVEEDDLECEHPPGTSMAALETKEVFLLKTYFNLVWEIIGLLFVSFT